MNLKEKVEQLCKNAGITVRELERRAELRPRTIQHWDTSDPSGEKLYRVAKALDVPIEELLSVYVPDLNRVAYIKKLVMENERLKNLTDKKEPATIGDGQLSEYETAVLNANERERNIILKILRLPPEQQDAFLTLTQSVPSNQADQDESKQTE